MKVMSTNEASTISLLGRQSAVEIPAITGLVTRLEQNGLVERVHDLEDRRLVKVSLTAEGKDILGSLDPVMAAFQERVLPHDEQRALIQHLQNLISHIGALDSTEAVTANPVREALRLFEHGKE
jgi:DNA-binding MarR family transcriptional regulator